MRCCLAALGRELGLDEIDEVADAVHETGTLGYAESQFGALSLYRSLRADQYPEVLVLYLERPRHHGAQPHDLGSGASDTTT